MSVLHFAVTTYYIWRQTCRQPVESAGNWLCVYWHAGLLCFSYWQRESNH